MRASIVAASLAAIAILVAASLIFEPREAIPFEGEAAPLPAAAAPAGLRVHVFRTGYMAVPGWAAWLGGEGEVEMDQPAYLIEHPRHGLVMFEAGHNPAIAEGAGAHLGWTHATGLLPMRQDPGQDARRQLAAAGFDPDDVRDLVVSHFHPEHVGAVESFPAARVVVDRRELAYGGDDPAYNYVPHEYDDVRRWRPLDFRGTPRFGPFEGTVDLVGDGSILVVSTPGHTPGHVSLYVRLPEGPVLLAGDVAWRQENLDTGSIGLAFVSSDGEGARRSLGKLRRLRADHPELLIVPGHDLRPLERAGRGDVVFHPWPAAAATAAR